MGPISFELPTAMHSAQCCCLTPIHGLAHGHHNHVRRLGSQHWPEPAVERAEHSLQVSTQGLLTGHCLPCQQEMDKELARYHASNTGLHAAVSDGHKQLAALRQDMDQRVFAARATGTQLRSAVLPHMHLQLRSPCSPRI